MPQTYKGPHPESGDKLTIGEDSQARTALNQQPDPESTDRFVGVTQGHTNVQKEKHGSSETATSKSTTGGPEKPHAHGDAPPSAQHGQAHQRTDT